MDLTGIDRRMVRVFIIATAFLGMTLLSVGCGSGPMPLVPVEGRVWYRGHLLSHGTVVFVPDEEKGHLGRMATSIIHPGGTFSLMTEKAPGAEPGWYRVTIASPALPSGMTFPLKFSDPSKSGVVREVKAATPNTIDIHLE